MQREENQVPKKRKHHRLNSAPQEKTQEKTKLDKQLENSAPYLSFKEYNEDEQKFVLTNEWKDKKDILTYINITFVNLMKDY